MDLSNLVRHAEKAWSKLGAVNGSGVHELSRIRMLLLSIDVTTGWSKVDSDLGS